MKKYILIVIFLCAAIVSAHPETDSLALSRFHFSKMLLDDCDACGCSANGGSMGLSSMFNTNFIGVRYFYQRYSSKEGIFNNSPYTDENFNTIQVWARIPIGKKVQVSALVPYHFHNRELTTGDENITGLGDVTVLAMYTLYQTEKDSTVLTHKLQVGGGFKLPTGKYDVANNSGSVNAGFQVGTGSWDYLLAAEYVVKRKQLGLNSMLNYVIKTENSKKYQFGNQLNYGSSLFYLFDKNTVKWVPQVGLAGEVYDSNTQHGQRVPDTSGDILFGKFGLEAGKDNFSIGLNAMLPMSQHLSGGNVEAKYRWSVNLNYSL